MVTSFPPGFSRLGSSRPTVGRARVAAQSRGLLISASPLSSDCSAAVCSPISTPWPLVGRERESAKFRAALGDDDCDGIVFVGPAGVGKTRLIRELATAAGGEGHPVETLSGMTGAASIPLGAFAHLLPETDAAADRLQLLRRLSEALRGRGGDARPVLAVDDAHLLDDASAALVLELARSDGPFLLVGVRAGEALPESVGALWREGTAQLVELGALTRPDVDELLTVGLGAPVEPVSLSQLWKLSAGNPLFLRELVSAGLDGGALTLVDGLWQWDEAPVTATRLIELVESRLVGVTEDERDALEVLVFGEPLGATLLESLCCPAATRGLERKGLVEATTDGSRVTVRLVHPLYADVLRAGTPPLRTRAVYGRLADALDQTGGHRPDDLLRLAVWRLESASAASPEL